ncbi:MAG TPA: hypothetical protein VMF68_05205, partial [Spirochaetia bacterium]|nr:hypothetical protein [Spirochaetia bacterium]
MGHLRWTADVHHCTCQELLQGNARADPAGPEKQRLASPKDLPAGMPRKVAVSIMAATVVSWWLEEGMKFSPEPVSAWMRHVLIRGYLT